ncbi:hypothetical protein AA313_de0206644 [Arthrobotrys entomopaga]|nr:hypothetical protein AA313_de0206644 [Arthrobotrys entomopaga]
MSQSTNEAAARSSESSVPPTPPENSVVFAKISPFYTTLPKDGFMLLKPHNEELLSSRMEDVSIYDPTNPRYQEHVCAIDFYKHFKSGQENAVIVKKGDESVGVQMESVAKEDDMTGPTNSSSWRFESAVLWNGGGGGKRETVTIQRNKMGSVHGRRQETTDSVSDQARKDTQKEGMSRAWEATTPTTPEVKGELPGLTQTTAVPISLLVDVTAEGAKIWDRICDSKSGWRYTFELFELGKVPDYHTFIVDTLGEFISKRQELWNKFEWEGFNLERYQASDENELFLRNSYREAMFEAAKRGDFERADKLFLKVSQVIGRRFKNLVASAEPMFAQVMIMIEATEFGIDGLYLYAKRVAEGWSGEGRIEKESAYSLDHWNDLRGDFKDFMSNNSRMIGIQYKCIFQLHFMLTTLKRGPDRYEKMASYEEWEPDFFEKVGTEIGTVIKDMEGIETLRLAADRDEEVPGMEDWNAHMKVRFPISKSKLYRLKRIGHKEMILENLATLYQTTKAPATRSAFDTSRRFEPSKLGTRVTSLTSQLPLPPVQNELPENRIAKEVIPVESLSTPLRSQKPRQRQSPWVVAPIAISQANGPTQQDIPRQTIGETERSSSRGRFPFRRPLNSDHGRENISSKPVQVERKDELSRLAATNLRMRNLADQPIIRKEECTPDQIQATTDFKHAVRNVTDLDFYIGQLASLHLINFIRGNPEYKPITPLIQAIGNQRWEAAKKMINLGASFTLGYPFHTALMKHTMISSRDRCQSMIDRGLIGPLPAGVDATSYFLSESLSMIMYMVDAGMDVTARGVANTDLEEQIETYPIHLAALDTDPNTVLVEYLIENGAKVWTKDKNGELAMDYARRTGNVWNIRLLEEAGKKQSKEYT